MNKALFLDRDGVVNIDTGHLYKIEDFKFIKGVPGLIKKYNNAGYKVIIVTNQSGIAKKYYIEKDMHRLHAHISKKLAENGAHIDALYFCPHHPDFTEACECRKPKPGMILQAARDLNIDLLGSIMVGDKESDILAGLSAGIGRLVLVRSGHPIDEENTRATEIIDGLWDLEV